MLNGKYVSCQEIIREVFRDNKYTYNLPWQDSIEWSVDAIELIGAPMALQPRQAKIKIENYRGMLPCNMHTLMQAAGSFDGCTVFSMRSKTNTFHPVHNCDTTWLNTELLGSIDSTTDLEQPIGQDISGNPVFEIDNENIAFPSVTTDTTSRSISQDATYELNDSFIFTNFSDGYVFIAFRAMPVDEEGFPLIPDDRRYKEAVKSFIRQKIDYILWRTGEIDEKMFRYSEGEWLWYVGSAGNSARMPNYDGMQSLLQQIKLIPNRYSHDEFFNHLGSK